MSNDRQVPGCHVSGVHDLTDHQTTTPPTPQSELRTPNSMSPMFSHDSLGRLVFHAPDGRQHTGVVPVRGFPISEPDYGIAICDADSRELLWIERLSQLSEADRQVIQAELADREFTPVL